MTVAAMEVSTHLGMLMEKIPAPGEGGRHSGGVRENILKLKGTDHRIKN